MAANQTNPTVSFWKQTASRIKTPPRADWMELLRENLRTCHPEKLAELAATDDLTAYLTVMTNSAAEQYQTMIEAGMTPETAKELALNQLLQQTPTDEDRSEPWEEEGALEEMAAAVGGQLSKS